jgi:hypothetical protein
MLPQIVCALVLLITLRHVTHHILERIRQNAEHILWPDHAEYI